MSDTAEPDDDSGGNPVERAAAGGKRVLTAIDRFQRGHRPLAVAFAVVKKFGDDQAGNLAALVAYYAFFSLFPLLLVFVTIVGFVLAGDTAAQERLLNSTLSQFPALGDQLRGSIGQVQGSGLALVVGLVAALWAGLGALDAMQNAMNSVWNVPKVSRPNLVKTRLRGLVMLVVFAVLITASTVLGGAAAIVDSIGIAGDGLALLATTALNVVLFLVAFKVLTDLDMDWRVMVPGAGAAGIAVSVLQAAGGWYVERVLRNATAMYGTFAIVLGLLSWLFLLAQMTVFSAEINVVVHRSLHPRSLTGDDLTSADEEALRHYAEVEARIPDETVHIVLPAEQAERPAGGDGPSAAARSEVTAKE
jgi:YihY family inner membrane protein